MFIDRNIRTRIALIKPHLALEVNSNPHKNNLALLTLSPIDHVIVRRYLSKQKWCHGKIVERMSCTMCKVLINEKIDDKHIDQIKKSQMTEKSDTKYDIRDDTIPLTEPTPNNSARKWYPTRNQKPVIRYVFEDK